MHRPTELLDALSRDLRHAVRALAKSPVFMVTAVATLAIGLGANAAIFSMVDALLLRALPYPDPGRLALVADHVRARGVEEEHLSQDGRTWELLRDHAESLDLAPYSDWVTGVNLLAGERAVNVEQQRVGAGFFRVLGAAPALGRGFSAEEDVPDGPRVAVLSYGLWQRAFHGDPKVLGRPILLRGEPHAVVGVMPEGFRSTAKADLWTPLRASTAGEGGGANYGIVARLRPGTSWAEASSEVAALAGPDWNQRNGGAEVEARFSVEPLRSGLVDGTTRSAVFLLWGAVALVWAIVCANLASLMLARGSERRREIAARMALGCRRWEVARQVLVECLVLALAGGALGLVLGVFGLEALSAMARDALGVWQPVALDGPVVAVTALLSLATSLAFGLGPALHAARLDPRLALAEGGGAGGGSSRWSRRLLVTAEVAMGVVLVVFAGLLVRTFLHLRSLDPGFDPAGVVTGTVSLEDARYATRERIEGLLNESLRRIRALPGVESAAVGLGLPYERLLNLGARVIAPGREPTEMTAVSSTYVTPGYFSTLGVPVLRGRTLRESDGPEAAPVVVVNRRFVEKFLPDTDPLASRVAISGKERRIVGVVGDVLESPEGLGGFAPVARVPVVYFPSAQLTGATFTLIHTWFQPSWIVRSSFPAAATIAGLRKAVAQVDAGLPFTAFRRLSEVESTALAEQRFLMALVAALGAVAALLAALGIQGLVANAVVERTRELGIRLALGATFGQALRTIAAPVAALTAAGIAVGWAAALAGGHLLEHFLFGVRATDPWTFTAGALLLALVAAAATLAPALRVLHLDPARTLREE
jgi:predicted permease